MEKRRSDRLAVTLTANIITGRKTYSGLIDNISECGVGYLLTSLEHVSKDFIPPKSVKMSFKTPSGETVSLTCKVKWFYRTSNDRDVTLGMEIVEPPSKYREYLKTLASNN